MLCVYLVEDTFEAEVEFFEGGAKFVVEDFEVEDIVRFGFLGVGGVLGFEEAGLDLAVGEVFLGGRAYALGDDFDYVVVDLFFGN